MVLLFVGVEGGGGYQCAAALAPKGVSAFPMAPFALIILSKLSTHLCELDCDRVSFMSSSQSISLDFAHVTGLTRTVQFHLVFSGIF